MSKPKAHIPRGLVRMIDFQKSPGRQGGLRLLVPPLVEGAYSKRMLLLLFMIYDRSPLVRKLTYQWTREERRGQK